MLVGDAALLARIDGLLAGGLQTAWQARAYTSDEVNAVCARLHGLAADNIAVKLAVAGLTRHPYVAADDDDAIEQSCATCMYFERHREFCALPELMLPVHSHWSCILWRI